MSAKSTCTWIAYLCEQLAVPSHSVGDWQVRMYVSRRRRMKNAHLLLQLVIDSVTIICSSFFVEGTCHQSADCSSFCSIGTAWSNCLLLQADDVTYCCSAAVTALKWYLQAFELPRPVQCVGFISSNIMLILAQQQLPGVANPRTEILRNLFWRLQHQ